MIIRDAVSNEEEKNLFQKNEWVFVKPDVGAAWWRMALMNEETVEKYPFKVAGYKIKGESIWYRCERNGAIIDNIPEDNISLAENFIPEKPKVKSNDDEFSVVEKDITETTKDEEKVIDEDKETKEGKNKESVIDEEGKKEDVELQEPKVKNDNAITSKTKRKTV